MNPRHHSAWYQQNVGQTQEHTSVPERAAWHVNAILQKLPHLSAALQKRERCGQGRMAIITRDVISSTDVSV